MVNHCRLNTVLYFPNCPRQPKTASGIRKDAELTLIADTMTIQIINPLTCLMETRTSRASMGLAGAGGERFLEGGGGLAPRAVAGVSMGSKWTRAGGSRFPSPGRCLARRRPHLPPPANSQARARFSNSPRWTTGGGLLHSSRHRARKCLHKPSPRRAESIWTG